jgi:hypothetical protein
MERVLGTDQRVRTRLFNGYAEFVGSSPACTRTSRASASMLEF